MTEGEAHVLPDLLSEGLKVVFCGTAAGARSAQVGAYYAGQGNKFWKILFQIGLTPRLLEPGEFWLLTQYGIGLTDIAKTYSGADMGLKRAHFDAEGLRLKIEKFAPTAFAFNGKKAARSFYATDVPYGIQQKILPVSTTGFVLPSTSGAASGFWDIRYWQQLADFLKER
ncbi:MAG: mismatch-specific DNA-glycosylase [Chloroflexota bacterium]